MKQQARPSKPQPPQFGHDGIDLFRALLILGLLLLACAIVLLVLFASPLVWWIAAGVTAAGVLGGLLLRRSGRARRLFKRVPGAGRVASALRRTGNGRFVRTPLGRVFNRALGRRPAGSPGGSSSRSKMLGGGLRSMLPSWAGGTRKRSAAGGRSKPPGGASSRRGPRAHAQAARKAMANMMPRRRRRREAAAGGPSGSTSASRKTGRRASPGGTAKGKTPGARSAAGASSTGKRRRTSPAGRRSAKTSDEGPADSVRHSTNAVARFFGLGAEVVRDALTATVESGASGECTTTVRGNRHLTRPGGGVQWPEVDQDEVKPEPLPPVRTELDPDWPATDPDEEKPQAAEAPAPDPDDDPQPDSGYRLRRPSARRREARERAERDRDPPPSPPPHREKPRSSPRITSTNAGGRPMTVSPTMHDDLITSASTRREGWQDASNAFRRNAAELDEKAKEHDAAARALKMAGDLSAAEEREQQARQLRDDARTCMTYASKYQEKANAEQSPAA